MHFMPGCEILRSYDLVNWEHAVYVYDVLDGTPGLCCVVAAFSSAIADRPVISSTTDGCIGSKDSGSSQSDSRDCESDKPVVFECQH